MIFFFLAYSSASDCSRYKHPVLIDANKAASNSKASISVEKALRRVY